MTLEESEPNTSSDHILDWLDSLEGSIPFLPPFLDDPYNSGQINGDHWWVENQDLDPELISSPSNNLQPSDSSKKRKGSDNPAPKPSQSHRKNQNRRNNEADDGDGVKRAVGGKKGSAKSAGNNCSNGNNRDGRWAEQLLNPCAAAVTAGNLTRVQHLLYVLHELASPSGDANHRLAAHGLRALTHFLSSPVSPWFMFPNKIANNSILQILSEQDQSRNLHILDIGVSHGVQWPTLLEALSRRSGGAPPLVRLTVVGTATDHDRITDNPFVISPPGYSFTSQLLCYAKSININLKINRLDNHPLQNLNAEIINFSPDETLIVCAHENNTDCSCTSCGNFATGFSRRVEYLWRFLDSSSAAFKGRESDERRVMEGEASKALMNSDEMNEGKEKWFERMRRVGFAGQVLGEDTIDEARALLRKYDSNWEMRVEEKDGCVGLWWKGQPVSFCSLWKLGDESK
ncbi:GRAS family transcription factor [Actinidia rufa]|uniref:GRAS family transcription factor n=1 Tax=Actinidia rufa TaxID=165716 RepID=A0A7J0FET0_9ERIC|nr:GRAS family transcription factor [Actinidia rufa]